MRPQRSSRMDWLGSTSVSARVKVQDGMTHGNKSRPITIMTSVPQDDAWTEAGLVDAWAAYNAFVKRNAAGRQTFRDPVGVVSWSFVPRRRDGLGREEMFFIQFGELIFRLGADKNLHIGLDNHLHWHSSSIGVMIRTIERFGHRI